ncbi:MAG: family transcriptional regulator [Hyphomicrobiales bacterium]|nr:family transcriptional regulator [Hyphomicrobiales bacterium]
MSKAAAPTFGQKLREARRSQGLSLVVVATRLGVSHGAVAKWEKDRARPRLKRILAIARVLRISPALLLNTSKEGSRDPVAVLRRAQERLAKAWNVPREAVMLTARRAGGNRRGDCELSVHR